MNERLEQELDAMLSRHFADALDDQAGRAAPAFAARLAARRRLRLGLSMGLSMAAGIALAFGLLNHFRARTGGPSTPAPIAQARTDAARPAPVVQSAAWSRLMDDGMGLYNNQPVRQLRRNVVEEIEWYDARHKAVVRTKVPREEIYLIGVKTD